ncbi:MAG: ribokinase [Bacteroidales bacterium]|nr:ribokinase [Bacteroidales bacterium]
MNTGLKIIVPGGLNTDLIGLGVERLLGPGELTLGGTFHVGPGGKARNMAQMAAAWLGPDQVAMIGKSVRDPFGLWKVPLDALKEAGVNTEAVQILDFEQAGRKFPGIALIPVDQSGRNQIYCIPGINNDFLPADILAAEEIFSNAVNPAYLMLALEIPTETVKASIESAKRHGIRVVLDPGGISPEAENHLLLQDIFLIKPNEHEAEILTGTPITGLESASEAAARLLSRGVQYVMITHGAHGAYLFGENIFKHIPAPEISGGNIHDETGCGDQVTATLTACLTEGMSVVQAAEVAVRAGTMQFHRKGIQPVRKSDVF